MSDDYEGKKYDTQATTVYWNARLTKDAEVKEWDDGNESVTLTVADDSRVETDAVMWVNVRPLDNQKNIAKKLKKGHKIGCEGKLCYSPWPAEDPTNAGFTLRYARLHLDPSLIAELGGGADDDEKPAKGKKAGKKVATKKAAKPAAKKAAAKPTPKKATPVEMDLDDDEDDDTEDADDDTEE